MLVLTFKALQGIGLAYLRDFVTPVISICPASLAKTSPWSKTQRPQAKIQFQGLQGKVQYPETESGAKFQGKVHGGWTNVRSKMEELFLVSLCTTEINSCRLVQLIRRDEAASSQVASPTSIAPLLSALCTPGSGRGDSSRSSVATVPLLCLLFLAGLPSLATAAFLPSHCQPAAYPITPLAF